MNPRAVLYVEDEEDDIFFVGLGFKSLGLDCSLQIARDGREGIDYLAGNGPFANRSEFPLPSLILLDLHLPFHSGLEVLQWIRQRSQFQSIPVLMFSASDKETDKTEAERLGANAFITKPNNMVHLPEVLKNIKDQWLDAP